MSHPGPTEAVSEPKEVRLRCAIGHEYSGTVTSVKTSSYDMDGELMWHSPSESYDPATCIVCGLKTWSLAPPRA